MKPNRIIRWLALGSTAMALLATPALAQRQEGTAEQRIERLEKQVQQMQRQVFPKGRPADTAGFADDPAATQSSVSAIAGRLDSLEKQMADLIRIIEENGNRQRTEESENQRIRSELERKIADLEARAASAPAAVAEPAPSAKETTVAAKPKPAETVALLETPKAPEPAVAEATPADPAEAAYTEGFKQWEAGRYDEAINSLRAFVAAYPKHRRTSFANNLIGRALLDKGEARAAVPAFIANYKSDPAGERAPDSLYYLGQALMKLGQPAQACNAYAELSEVYGAKLRPELKKLQAEARQDAQCKD